jgi:hypothetical protein
MVPWLSVVIPNGPVRPWGTTERIRSPAQISVIPPPAKLETNIRLSLSNAALSSPTTPVVMIDLCPVPRSMRVIRPSGPQDSTIRTPARSNRTATGASRSAATSSGTPPSGEIRQTCLVIMCG